MAIFAAAVVQVDVRLILDNYCTYKHAKSRAWLA